MLQNTKLFTVVLLVIFCLVFFIFFSFKITEVPPGVLGDEAAIGYNAALIAKTGRDENNRFLPLFVSTAEDKDWKQPLTMYSNVIFYKLFGPSLTHFRQVSIIFILAAIILCFYSIKEAINFKAALMSLVIFATIPIVMIQSHLGFENIAPLPFVSLWFLMLIKYLKQKKNKFVLISGLTLGVSLFTYQAMRIIVPVQALLTVLFILYINRGHKFNEIRTALGYFLVGLGLFLLLLPVTKILYPGALGANNRPMPTESYQRFFLPYLSSFDLTFLFMTGDSTPYHSTGRQGIFLLASLPLFLVGTYQAIKSKNPFLILVFLTFILSPIFFGLVASVHRGSRLLALIPSFVILTSLGFSTIFKEVKQKYRILAAIIIILVFGLNYIDFLRDYWFDYPGRVKGEFKNTSHLSFERLYKISKTMNLQPMVEYGLYQREGYSAKFFEQVYFSVKLKQWDTNEQIPKSGSLLATPNLENLKKQGYEEENHSDDHYSIYTKI